MLGYDASSANRSLMPRHRTTARGILLLILVAATAGAAAARPPAESDGLRAKAAPEIVFPVVGRATFSDDFGDPRSQGRHEGNDIMAARRAPAVAAEGGTVTLWTTSRAAGCMLYLHGDSGTTYLYIHLNNDLGRGNDNRGECVPGVAYAPGLKTGDRVEAGEPVGFVGDSGDANGIQPHLHFELHPGGGAAVDPYRALTGARRLLFAARQGTSFTLALSGTAVAAADGTLSLKVGSVRSWPGGRRVAHDGPLVEVDLGDAAALDPGGVEGRPVTVWTAPARVTLAAQWGAPGALVAARVVER